MMTVETLKRVTMSVAPETQAKRNASLCVPETPVLEVPLVLLPTTKRLANVTTHCKEMAIQLAMKVRPNLPSILYILALSMAQTSIKLKRDLNLK